MAMKTSINQMFSIEEIAERFAVTPRTVRAAIREGRLRAVPIRWRKRKNLTEMVPYDYRITRAEFRRIENEGLRFPVEGGAN
jgi:excisionase family DNA binding protein